MRISPHFDYVECILTPGYNRTSHENMQEFGLGLALILGLVEGLTEFLPVSSTGHLILVGHFLGFTGEVAVSIDICIQLGSILAIVAYERRKILELFREACREQKALRHFVHASRSKNGRESAQSWLALFQQSCQIHPNLLFLVGLIVAFLPSAFVGFMTHSWIETHLFSAQTVAISLIVGGIIIYIVEMWPRKERVSQLHQVGIRPALMVGLAQCAALIPGMSRSGSTIIGGLLTGLNRKVATEYSFFLALPTMLAATFYKLVQSFHLFSWEDALALFIGMVVSFVVAWVVISLFLTYVKRHTLRVFAFYRIGLGIVLLFFLQ